MESLLKLRATDLKRLAHYCGSATSGTKPVLFESLKRTITDRIGRGQTGNYSIVSVDLGIENIGVCQIRAPPRRASNPTHHSAGNPGNGKLAVSKPVVERWFHHTLAKPFVHRYPAFADQAIALANMFDSCDAFVIEKQRTRTGGSATIPNSILWVNVLEGMLFTALRLRNPNALLESVSPRSVVKFWQSEKAADNLSSAQMYKMAKKVRTQVVNSWQQDPSSAPFVFHNDEISAKKRDDVNDAIVQAYTWLLWRDNCGQLVENVEMGVDPFENLVTGEQPRLDRA